MGEEQRIEEDCEEEMRGRHKSYEYTQTQTSGGCCTVDNEHHATCRLVESDYLNCQTFCDQDRGCKGFARKKRIFGEYWCVLATGSRCGEGWTRKDDWNVKPLDPNAKCKWGYSGCFIKNLDQSIDYEHNIDFCVKLLRPKMRGRVKRCMKRKNN